MRYLFIIILIFVGFLQTLAQTDETQWSITYQAKCRFFETDKSLSEEMQCLAIGKHSSRYFSLQLEWYKKNAGNNCPFKGRLMQFEVYKNMPKSNTMTFIHMPFWVTVEDQMDNLFQWELQDGDTIICNYPCKKAMTNFRGRIWTVWYSLDLPFNDGPWKFHGLPGLILSAYDSESLFHFNCVGVEKGNGELYEYPPFKGKNLVTPKRACELMTMEHMDNDAYTYLMIGGRRVGERRVNGKPQRFIPKKPCLYEIFP